MRTKKVEEIVPRSEEEVSLPLVAFTKQNLAGPFCVCRGEDDGSPMICCDQCDEWYHLDCIGLTPKTSKQLKKFYCSRCRAAQDPLGPSTWEGQGDSESGEELEEPGQRKRTEEGRTKKIDEKRTEDGKGKREEGRGKRLDEGREDRGGPLKKAKGAEGEARRKAAEALAEVLNQDIPEGPEASQGPNAKSGASLKSMSIATALENELAGLHGGVGREYRQQVRSLVFNLKLPHNQPLRYALLNGSLSPFALARMNSQDLAPAALAEYRRTRDEKYFDQVVIRSENEHPLLAKKAEHLEATAVHDPSPVSHPVPTPLPEEPKEVAASPPLSPSHFDTFDSFDSSPPPPEGESVESELPRTPDSPVGEVIPLPSFNEFVEEEEGPEEAEVPQVSGGSGSAPLGWTGFVKTDASKSFRLVGEHVRGKHVEKFLPETLTQVGRMDRGALVDYLTQITFSTSRHLSVVVFSPEAPSDAPSYAATVEYFQARGRAAVIKTKHNGQLKEAFLIPLPALDVPSWVEGLTPSEEPRLLGAFISLKSKSREKEKVKNKEKVKDKEKVKEKEKRDRTPRSLPPQASASHLSQPPPIPTPVVPSQAFMPFQHPPSALPTNHSHYPAPFYPQAYLPTSSNQTQDSSNVFSSLLTSLQNFGQQKQPPNPPMSDPRHPNRFQQMPPQNFQNGGGNFFRP